MTPDYAWAHREGRNTRYNNKRVGGTVCIHFIKKNMWFLETALAFLETQDTTELEMRPSEPDEESRLISSGPINMGSRKSRYRSGSSVYREDPVGLEPLVDSDTKDGHTMPVRSDKDKHVLPIQAGAERLQVHVEGGGSGGSVVLPVDELERSEGIPKEDNRRGVNSDANGERNREGTTTLPTAGHFANGSKRVKKR